MEYFSKLTDEGELIVTSISDDSEIIILKGDYIKIWELIQSPVVDPQTYKNTISDEDISFLKPFLNFLHFNKFGFSINSNIKSELNLRYKTGINGGFEIFEHLSNEVYAQECSDAGTDGYGNAEDWIAGCSGRNEWY